MAAAQAEDIGVVVEAVHPGRAADLSGITSGTILTSWSGSAAHGPLRSPFDVVEVETDHAPRGPVTLNGTRDGKAFTVTLASADWGMSARPRMEGAALSAYTLGLTAAAEGRIEEALERWREATRLAVEHRDLATAAWLSSKVASILVKPATARNSPKSARDQARAAYTEASKAAETTGNPITWAQALEAEADALVSFGSVDEASERYIAAAKARPRGQAQTLAVAQILRKQARAWRESVGPTTISEIARRGYVLDEDQAATLSAADQALLAAMRIAQRLAPDSRAVALILNERALVAARQLRLDDGRRLLATTQAMEARGVSTPLDSAQTRKTFEGIELLWGISAKAFTQSGGTFIEHQAYLADVQRDLDRARVIYEQLYPGCDEAAGNASATLVAGCRRLAYALNNLGMVTAQRGNPASGQRLIERALALNTALRSRKVYDAPSPLGGVVLNDADAAADVTRNFNNLGTIAWLRGDLDTAADYYGRPVEALRACGRRCEGALALTKRHLAKVEIARGNFPAAKRLYQEALAIDTRDLEAADPRFSSVPAERYVAIDYKGLAEVARASREYDNAKTSYLEALGRQRKAVPESLEIAETLTELGTLARQQDELPDAEKYLREALSIAADVVPESFQGAAAAHALANVLAQAGRTEEAAKHFRLAIETVESGTGRLGGAEDVRSRFVARRSAIYYDFARLLLDGKDYPAAFDVIERSRAQSLRALLAERDLTLSRDIPVPLAREREAVNREYDMMDARLRVGDGDPAALKARLRELRDRRQTIADRIRDASPRVAAVQYPDPLDLRRAREALDPGTLLLSYAVGDTETVLFAVQPAGAPGASPDGLQVFRLPIGRLQLQDDVRLLLLAIGVQSNVTGRTRGAGDTPPRRPVRVSANDVGARLFDALVKPAYPLVAASTRVLISADGPLHELPFAALLERDAPAGKDRYLIEWKPLHLIVSTTVYAEMRSRRWKAGSAAVTPVFAFGDPNYARVSATDDGRLISTRPEVERIAALFPQAAKVFVGADAREQQLKQVAGGQGRPQLRYLHIASHGLLDKAFPLNSALAFSTESPSGRENGLLQAWEIYEQLQMDADLVSLSACESGSGEEIGGEGLISLSRAFLYAGAHSVVASLWKVDDDSTAELMGRFYAALKEGRPKDDALRAAQIDLIHGARSTPVTAESGEWSRPFHWAAFTLSGDWR